MVKRILTRIEALEPRVVTRYGYYVYYDTETGAKNRSEWFESDKPVSEDQLRIWTQHRWDTRDNRRTHSD